ncbi:MAG TPA: 2Fe-2S iron-sulfur cluster-binding protein, partial [Acidimicrobiales bacterium]|nr:2Fe-2S iron-sulfur cluster-binding protein [Acidimicrobiales bacterium]
MRDDVSLLSALREDLGVRQPVKDGCSPQGQCGCCTVLVDGSPRVACVTAVRRVAGRSVVTAAGLDPQIQRRLVDAFARHGASQCGFCTPGILCRLAALGPSPDRSKVESALLAHLCRCTGWRTIVDAACDQVTDAGELADAGVGAGATLGSAGDSRHGRRPFPAGSAAKNADRFQESLSPSDLRAAVEGGVAQRVGRDAILGAGGFADDDPPRNCLCAVPDGAGGWAVGETIDEARAASGKVQGRRSGQALSYPLEVAPGAWDLTLQTTWVEPAYLEPDASWCHPGGEPADPVANGGAFGGKLGSIAPATARLLADRFGRPVRVLLSREDVVRLGSKRPPIAAGVNVDGTGVLRIAAARTGDDRFDAGLAGAIEAIAPGLRVEVIPIAGPPASWRLRAAGWAEAAVLAAGAEAVRSGKVPTGTPSTMTAAAQVRAPNGATARAEVTVDPGGWPETVSVDLGCGPPLDPVVLCSYATGAAHMALGWV